MMDVDIYLNELSIPNGSISKQAETEMLNLYDGLRAKGITVCRVSDGYLSRLWNTVEQRPNGRILLPLVQTFFQAPYESKDNESSQEAYLANVWHCGSVDCYGLALACLQDTLAISWYASEWDKPLIEITKNGVAREARNACTVLHLDSHEDWLEAQKGVEPPKSTVNPANKKISLRQDHGIKELREHAGKMRNCPYVSGIVNSLEFKPWGRNYIDGIRKQNGKWLIDVILVWTPQGLGMVVETTARNIREARYVADVLSKEYGYR